MRKWIYQTGVVLSLIAAPPLSAVVVPQAVVEEENGKITLKWIGNLLAQGNVPGAMVLLELAKRNITPVMVTNSEDSAIYFDVVALEKVGIDVYGSAPRVSKDGIECVDVGGVDIDTSSTVFDPQLFTQNAIDEFTFKYDSTNTAYIDVTAWDDIVKENPEVAKQLISVGYEGNTKRYLLNKDIADYDSGTLKTWGGGRKRFFTQP